MITAAQIEELAGRKGVRRIAVENFLGTTLGSLTVREALRNLYVDANDYKWNVATREAILHGILLNFKMTRYCFCWSITGSTIIEASNVAEAQKQFDDMSTAELEQNSSITVRALQ